MKLSPEEWSNLISPKYTTFPNIFGCGFAVTISSDEDMIALTYGCRHSIVKEEGVIRVINEYLQENNGILMITAGMLDVPIKVLVYQLLKQKNVQ